MRWLASPLLIISIASFLVSVFLLNHTERLRLDGVVDTTHRGTDSRHEPISPSVLGHDYNLQVAASTPDYTLPLLPVADREAQVWRRAQDVRALAALHQLHQPARCRPPHKRQPPRV